jgi:hypothetical protein
MGKQRTYRNCWDASDSDVEAEVEELQPPRKVQIPLSTVDTLDAEQEVQAQVHESLKRCTDEWNASRSKPISGRHKKQLTRSKSISRLLRPRLSKIRSKRSLVQLRRKSSRTQNTADPERLDETKTPSKKRLVNSNEYDVDASDIHPSDVQRMINAIEGMKSPKGRKNVKSIEWIKENPDEHNKGLRLTRYPSPKYEPTLRLYMLTSTGPSDPKGVTACRSTIETLNEIQPAAKPLLLPLSTKTQKHIHTANSANSSLISSIQSSETVKVHYESRNTLPTRSAALEESALGTSRNHDLETLTPAEIEATPSQSVSKAPMQLCNVNIAKVPHAACSNNEMSSGASFIRNDRRVDNRSSSSGISSSKIPAAWGKVVMDTSTSIMCSRPTSCVVGCRDVASTSQKPVAGSINHSITSLNGLDNVSISTSISRDSRFREEMDEQDNISYRQGRGKISACDQYGIGAPTTASGKQEDLSDENQVSQAAGSLKAKQNPPTVTEEKSLLNTTDLVPLPKLKSASLLSFNEPSEEVLKPKIRRPSRSVLLMSYDGKSNTILDKALEISQAERQAMFLPGNKDQAILNPFRERSSSFSRPQAQPPLIESMDPLRLENQESLPKTSPSQASDKSMDRHELLSRVPTSSLGTWSRYPSHTRDQRNGSAGPANGIYPQDFAMENSLRDLAAHVEGGTQDERAAPRKTKNQPKLSRSLIPRSRSLNFMNFFKSYGRIFRSHSTEFNQHGHGHRTSISAGGILEYPELELIAPFYPVFPHQVESTESTPKQRNGNPITRIPQGEERTRVTSLLGATMEARAVSPRALVITF